MKYFILNHIIMISLINFVSLFSLIKLTKAEEIELPTLSRTEAETSEPNYSGEIRDKDLIRNNINFKLNIHSSTQPAQWIISSEFIHDYYGIAFKDENDVKDKYMKLKEGLERGGWSSITDASFPLKENIRIDEYKKSRGYAEPIYTLNQADSFIDQLQINGTISVNEHINYCENCDSSYFKMKEDESVQLKIMCFDENGSFEAFEIPTNEPLVIKGYGKQIINFNTQLDDVKDDLKKMIKIQKCEGQTNIPLKLACALYPLSLKDQNLFSENFSNSLNSRYKNKDTELLEIQLSTWPYQSLFFLNTTFQDIKTINIYNAYLNLDELSFKSPINRYNPVLKTQLLSHKPILFNNDASLANAVAQGVLKALKNDKSLKLEKHERKHSKKVQRLSMVKIDFRIHLKNPLYYDLLKNSKST